MARTWLEACSNHHPDCSLPPLPGRTLPRRLLDLSSAGTQRIGIFETTPLFSDEYVALSYCWGPVKDTPWLSQWLSYIIETQQQSKHALDMRRMPKTLQDAVQVCLALGYQWLWVDCLCILQGSNSDWQIESAKMSEIYEGSALTLSASEASDCRDGFLIPRSEAQLQGAVLKLQTADGNAGSLHLCIQSNEFGDLVRSGAVSSRAWNALDVGDTSPNLSLPLNSQVRLIIRVSRGMSTSSKDLASLLHRRQVFCSGTQPWKTTRCEI
jgi:Heterokaryon incompatibility protein (HET)